MSRLQLVSVYTREQDLVAAVGELGAAGLPITEVYTPYAVHGLDRVAGLPRSRMGVVCALAATVGSVVFFFFQDWASALSWPLNVGGKPFSSLPAWIPVVFEAGVLTAGLTTVAVMFAASRLYPGKRAELVHPRVTDDRFVIVQEVADSSFDLASARAICNRNGAETVEERQLPWRKKKGEKPPIQQLEVWR